MKNLTLNLGRNQLGDKGIMYVGETVSNLRELRILALNLSENGIFGSDGFCSFCKGISNLGDLQELDLNFDDNRIGERGALYLGGSMGGFQGLKKLRVCLAKNGICSQGV